MITVNDRVSTLGTLKTKAFGWALIRTGCFIRAGHLLRKFKKKLNSSKYIFHKSHKISSRFPSKIDHKMFLFLLFKLALNFNLALKQTWVLIQMWVLVKDFSSRNGRLLRLDA